MEETTWKKLLDEALVELYCDADDKLGCYMREEAPNDVLRYIVQEVERRIKKLVDSGGGNNAWLFRHFSESEIDLLDYYFSIRDFALDLLMRNPTEKEIERLGYINDKLYRLSKECFEQCRNLSRTLRETPHKVDDHDLYSVRGMLHYEYSDETSVVAMPNDDYYGSDFQYMIRLKETLVGLEPAECSSIAPPCSDEMGEDESYAVKCWNDFDDGVSWAEGHLHNPAYDKYCICYALHALHTHSRDYCLPDILRMDNFKVLVRLQYDRDECDTPEDYYDDFDPDCPKGLSGEEFETYRKICQKFKEYDKKHPIRRHIV